LNRDWPKLCEGLVKKIIFATGQVRLKKLLAKEEKDTY
jgi:precorrin isomerase